MCPRICSSVCVAHIRDESAATQTAPASSPKMRPIDWRLMRAGTSQPTHTRNEPPADWSWPASSLARRVRARRRLRDTAPPGERRVFAQTLSLSISGSYRERRDSYFFASALPGGGCEGGSQVQPRRALSRSLYVAAELTLPPLELNDDDDEQYATTTTTTTMTLKADASSRATYGVGNPI